jgi:hypothetical protein
VDATGAIIGVAAVVAVCLWLLFRPGSMAARTERDDALGLGPDDAPSGEPPASGSPEGGPNG